MTQYKPEHSRLKVFRNTFSSGRRPRRLADAVKPVASIQVCLLRFLAIFLAFAAALVVTMGAAGLRQMSTGQFLGSGLLLAAGAALFSLSLARQMAPGSRRGIPTW